MSSPIRLWTRKNATPANQSGTPLEREGNSPSGGLRGRENAVKLASQLRGVWGGNHTKESVGGGTIRPSDCRDLGRGYGCRLLIKMNQGIESFCRSCGTALSSLTEADTSTFAVCLDFNGEEVFFFPGIVGTSVIRAKHPLFPITQIVARECC